MTNAILTLDLGWGDSGKGATVDFFCSQMKTSYVVRYSGGHQCGHNVFTPNGRSHCFSQFGSGSFCNVPTVVDRDVLIDPVAMKKEADHLISLGVTPTLLVHKDCSVTSIFHKIANRKTRNTGTCGKGIGMTRYTDLKGVRLHATDSFSETVEKLRAIRAILEDYTQSSIDYSIYNEAKTLHDHYNMRMFSTFDDYSFLKNAKGFLVFEASQGLMLNEYGFRPEESTWGNVSMRNAIELLNHLDIPFTTYGIIRSYISRHGGELPYEEIKMKDECNPYNQYQGEMKFYEWPEELLLDLTTKTDLLVVNHLDETSHTILSFMDRHPEIRQRIAITGMGKNRSDRQWNKIIV